jgi:hypothetical protein
VNMNSNTAWLQEMGVLGTISITHFPFEPERVFRSAIEDTQLRMLHTHTLRELDSYALQAELHCTYLDDERWTNERNDDVAWMMV